MAYMAMLSTTFLFALDNTIVRRLTIILPTNHTIYTIPTRP